MKGRDYSKALLTREEAFELFDNQLWIRLATLDGSGEIWNFPTNFVREGSSLFFEDDEDSIIIQNIAKKDDICAVLDEGESYDDVKGLIVKVKASVLKTDEKLSTELDKLMQKKYHKLSLHVPVSVFHSSQNPRYLELKLPEEPETISWSYDKRLH